MNERSGAAPGKGAVCQFLLKSPEETRQLGLRIAERLKAGDLLAMSGDLGAGKTTLTKAIAEGLGVREMVQSPSYTILREYHSGRLPLYHFDVYRLEDPSEMYELGYEEYFYGDGVSVVEWAGQVADFLPPGALRLRMEYGAAEDERVCTIEGMEL